MADLIEDIARTLKQDEIPDTSYEHKICGVTLTVAVGFIAATLFYVFSSADPSLKGTVMAVAAGLFVLVLLGFFASAFAGKLCGRR